MRILVVGQGLAGTLASHFALERGWDVHVIDAGLPSASSVAAGMYNPMSFRRIVEVWDASEHLSAMTAAFHQIEAILDVTLLHPLPIQKCLPNDEYAQLWHEKAQHISWISPVQPDSKQGLVQGGGWVNLPLLLHKWRCHLEDIGRFEKRQMTPADLEELNSHSDNILIDCRGLGASRSSATGIHQTGFTANGMDIRANRGEILTLSFPRGVTPPDGVIQNFGKWTIPIGSGQWRLGASYEWQRNDLHPTAETREQLLQKMHENIAGIGNPLVLDHLVGLRPVSRDRRPAVGRHPDHDRWYFLNGLGTRGVLIGPRWAQWLMGHIEGQNPSIPMVDPSRLF